MAEPGIRAAALAPAVVRLSLAEGERAITHAQAFDALARRADWADLFSALVLHSGFDALFWELPPLAHDSLDEPFECVVTASDALARLRADPTPFSERFSGPEASVVTFPNLGGDAILIAPTPHGDAAYTHLAKFCREAPRDRQRAFWHAVADAVTANTSARPIWVSTSGLGVGWLHARIDERPKYYTHTPYRHAR